VLKVELTINQKWTKRTPGRRKIDVVSISITEQDTVMTISNSK